MVRVFISYRREGGEQLAGRIKEHFERVYPHIIELFWDIDSMRAGKFNEQIYNEIETRDCVIVLLPPNALDRCVNEDDWVRLEIAYALKHKKPIIPLMMTGFEWPENMPDDIKKIAEYHGMMKPDDDLFEARMEKLAHMIYQAVEKRYPLFNYKKVFVGIAAVIILAGGLLGIKTYIDHQLTKTASVVVKEQNVEECQVEMLAVVNGMVMEDNHRYKVAAGDEIVVTAGSTETDIAFIAYYFSNTSYEDRIKVNADHVVITVPEGVTGSCVNLLVEPVASNDDGTPNEVTKTGWQKYTLEYVDSQDVSTPDIVLSEPYITISGTVDHESKELVCSIISDEVESVTYWWAPWDGTTQSADVDSEPYFVGNIAFNEISYLNVQAELKDGTSFRECYPIPSDREYVVTEDVTAPLLSISASDSHIYAAATDGGEISARGYIWNESNYLYSCSYEGWKEKSVTFEIGDKIENQWLSVYAQDKTGNFVIESVQVKGK